MKNQNVRKFEYDVFKYANFMRTKHKMSKLEILKIQYAEAEICWS